MSLNLSHRHCTYDPQEPDLVALYDESGLMYDRAQASLHLVQSQLIGGDRTLEDCVLFEALESVRLELQDMNASLKHFVDSKVSISGMLEEIQNKQA